MVAIEIRAVRTRLVAAEPSRVSDHQRSELAAPVTTGPTYCSIPDSGLGEEAVGFKPERLERQSFDEPCTTAVVNRRSAGERTRMVNLVVGEHYRGLLLANEMIHSPGEPDRALHDLRVERGDLKARCSQSTWRCNIARFIHGGVDPHPHPRHRIR